MYRVIECLTQEHDHGLVAVAALVCIIGACLTAQIARRLISARGARKRFQSFLASLIGGATIWSTHFIAMLAYEPGYVHGYEPVMTAVSLAVAVLGLLGAAVILGYTRSPVNYLLGGGAFGSTVAAMHFAGMSAYKLPGDIVWDPRLVLVSILLGAGLGAAAYHRIVHPNTRYCWMGGAVLMVLAICAMHFTGMAALKLELNPLIEVPTQVMPDGLLGIVIFGVTAVIFFVGFVGMNIETHLEREALADIEKTATHDALTGMPNRLLLAKQMRNVAASLDRDKTLRAAVLTIDLNRFKEVNDLHGHSAGDAVLTEIARRLHLACENDEFIARTGGDEFVALKKGFRRIEEVKAFAERLHTLIVEPISFGNVEFAVGGAIGVATTIHDGKDLDDLMQKSDLAMYRAKADGGMDVCLFNAQMDEQNRERLLLNQDLSLAIARGEFELVYQLQNDVNSREPTGFEVLLRWNHPTRGRVSPADFIPLAEETGLIREIGLWVLRTACKEAARWERPYGIAVNVAPQQLAQPSFLEHLTDILMESELDPQRLELEVTEASIIDDQEYTLKVMHKIKRMRVRVAMDDFGTGYSSLATLQAFPFDKIKIDKSFVKDVHLDHQRAAIVRSTLLLGKALDIPVLAEGVELEHEMSFLQQESCQYVQGFLFGRPMSAGEIREIVSATTKNLAPLSTPIAGTAPVQLHRPD